MKKCQKCKQQKPLNTFSKNSSHKDGLQRYCKQCKKEIDAKYKQNDIEKYKQYSKDRHKQHREWLNNIRKKHICAKCGENRFYLIDFHHLDPFQKDFTISGNHFGKKKITEEIKKCVPLCSNCHREFHYLERTKNTQIQDYLVLFFNVIEKKLL